MKIIRLFTLLLFTMTFLQLRAYEERNLLQERATYEQVKEALVMDQKWVPFPDGFVEGYLYSIRRKIP